MRFPQQNERESALDGNSSPRHAHHKEEKKAKKRRPQNAGQFRFKKEKGKKQKKKGQN